MMSPTPAPAADAAGRIRVLYAASSAADGHLVRSEVSASAPRITMACATSAREALMCLQTFGPFDAVLVDRELTDGDSAGLISQMRHDHPRLSIVALVPGEDESAARPSVEAGADAWLPKGNQHLGRLYPTLADAIARRRDGSSTVQPGVEPPAPAEIAPGPGPTAVTATQETASADGRPEPGRAAADAPDAVSPDEPGQSPTFEGAGAVDRPSSEAAVEAVTPVQVVGPEAAHQAPDQHSHEREQLEAALAARDAEIVRLRDDLEQRRQQHEGELAELQTSRADQERELRNILGDRERQLADLQKLLADRGEEISALSSEVAAAREAAAAAAPAAQAEAPPSGQPQSHERERLDARAEAGRLIWAVIDDLVGILDGIERAQASLRSAISNGESPEAALAGLDEATQQGRVLTRMVRAFSRREIQRARVVEPNDLVRTLEPTITRVLDEDVELVFEFGENLDRVAINPMEMELALVTAIMAVRPRLSTGGRVTIATSQVLPAHAPADGTVRPPQVQVAVTAVPWRREIPIAELASDRWFARGPSQTPDLSYVADMLRTHGGGLHADLGSAEKATVTLALPGVSGSTTQAG